MTNGQNLSRGTTPPTDRSNYNSEEQLVWGLLSKLRKTSYFIHLYYNNI